MLYSCLCFYRITPYDLCTPKHTLYKQVKRLILQRNITKVKHMCCVHTQRRNGKILYAQNLWYKIGRIAHEHAPCGLFREKKRTFFFKFCENISRMFNQQSHRNQKVSVHRYSRYFCCPEMECRIPTIIYTNITHRT